MGNATLSLSLSLSLGVGSFLGISFRLDVGNVSLSLSRMMCWRVWTHSNLQLHFPSQMQSEKMPNTFEGADHSCPCSNEFAEQSILTSHARAW